MSRRVGSPNAFVTALTAAANSSGLSAAWSTPGILPTSVVEISRPAIRTFTGAAMPSEAAVVEALRGVDDPELHRSIVDLGMVRGVDISGGSVGVTVALTVAGCPLRTEITRRVTDAVMPLDGVDAVDVELVVMTDQERQEL